MKNRYSMMRRSWAMLAAGVMLLGTTSAQVAMDGSGAYTENFNSMGASGTSLPAEWSSTRSPLVVGTGSSNSGGLYNFGASGSSERALGSMGSGSTGTFYYGVLLRNTTGAEITNIRVAYTGEQWRAASTNTNTLTFGYKTSSGAISLTDASWSASSALNFSNPNSGTSGAVDGNNATNRTVKPATTIVASLPAGHYLMIRWMQIDNSGSDHGLAVDDLSVTWTAGPPPPAPVATFTGLTNGAAGSPLVAGSTEQVLFGFSATSTASGSTSPTTQTLTALSLSTTSDPSGALQNVRLVRSVDTDPGTNGDNTEIGAFTLAPSALNITGIAQALNGTAKHYFVIGDIQNTVSVGTPSFGVSMSEGSTSLSGGDEEAFGLSSTVYTFVGSGSPVLDASAITPFGDVCINTDLPPTASFTLTGTDLEPGDDVIVGPLEGFAFFDPNLFDFVPTLTIAQEGALSVEITVRFLPDMVGNYDGSITISGGGGATTVPVSGSGVDTAPSVTTGAITLVGLDGATVAGAITDPGCSALDVVGVEFSTTANFTPGTGTIVLGSTGDTWTVVLAELAPCTNYHVRAFASNSGGTSYGDEAIFTTTDPPAPVATSAIGIFSAGFTAQWEAVPGATGYLLDVSTFPQFAETSYAADLFISEYIEATSGNEKYIEIYNGTGSAVDLGGYELLRFSNGSTTPSVIPMSGTLPSGEVAVYSHTSAVAYGGTVNGTSGSLDFNGDDAVALRRTSDNAYVDIFGRIGEDPGSFWSGGGFNTQNVTLQRKSSVTGGITVNPGAGFPTLATEWNDLGSGNNVSALGNHTSVVPSVTPSFVDGSEAVPVPGTSLQVTGLALGVTYYYRVRAILGDCVSMNSNVVNVTTACDPVVIAEVSTNAPGPVGICSADLELAVVVASGEGEYSHLWSGTGSFVPDGTTANVNVVGGATGTYAVEVSNGCSTASGSVDVVVEAATAWYEDADDDGFGDPLSQLFACEQPVGYILDDSDDCPGAPGRVGSSCDPGPGFIVGQLDGACTCVGVACTTDLVLDVTIPGFVVNGPSFELRDVTNDLVVQSAGGGPMNGGTPNQLFTCLPDGHYYLVVNDMPAGGRYVLRLATAPFTRIVENTAAVAGTSQVLEFAVTAPAPSSIGTVQLPIGPSELLYTSCDKYFWKKGEFIVVNEDADVAAEWVPGGGTAGQS
ncbi:MAG: lamin tail domain-containing protein, partial [Flavobacteriales bacterium]|nr:lamin tail domain-containing protein [Flavobacteriales bacterium]